MDHYMVFPDKDIHSAGPVSDQFLALGIDKFRSACRFVHELPYGYNSDRDDLMILFNENVGSCTTKHAVIATLAKELALAVGKAVGIYAMTEELVCGAGRILSKYNLPYVPMLHCYLIYQTYRVDLTEGNQNGKKRPINEFLYTVQVTPNISAKDEYLLYRKALKDIISRRKELHDFDIKKILQAREEGLALLRANLQ